MPRHPHRARRPGIAHAPRRRRALIATAIAALVITPLSVTAVATAVSLNADTTPTATLSATEGQVGDAITLSLGATDGDDIYAANVSLTFDASRLALDEDAIASEFPGMFSVVGDVDGDEGHLEFTLTRLGTSSGETGDISLGELGFISSSWGDASIVIDSVTIVDSELGRIEHTPETALTFSVPAPPEPTTDPEPTTKPTTAPEPTVAPVDAAPPSSGTHSRPTPISVNGYGSGTQRGTAGGGAVIAAPQTSAAPTNEPAQIVASSTTPMVGDTLTLTVTGLTASAEHRIELHSDPIVLGTAVSDAAGALTFDAVIPEGAPTGEHEIVVIEGDSVVATLPITIAAAEDVAAPQPSASTAAPEDADVDAAADARGTDSGARFMWVLIALLVVIVAAVIVVFIVRSRRAGVEQ